MQNCSNVRLRLKADVNVAGADGIGWNGERERERERSGMMVERNLSCGERVSVRACVEGSGWPKGGVVARHRCVSDVICGCHGDAIDWPTRRQTSRESRRHSDYCPSPRPSDYTPTSTPSSSSFTPIHPVSRERRGALLSSPPSRAFTTNVVHSHATPIPAPRVQTHSTRV